MSLAPTNSTQNLQARSIIDELNRTQNATSNDSQADSTASSSGDATVGTLSGGSQNATNGQSTGFNLQSAMSQGNTEQVASYLQSNPQERSQVYDQLLKTDMGMIYHLDSKLAQANTSQTAKATDSTSGDSTTGNTAPQAAKGATSSSNDSAVASAQQNAKATGGTRSDSTATTDSNVGSSSKAAPAKGVNDAASDGYLSSASFKSLTAAEKSKVTKQVSELGNVADYKKATGNEKAFMRESVARGAILAARPNNAEAKTNVAQVLNNNTTASLLRDKQGFSTQFLKATGSSLTKAADVHLRTRPQDAVVKGISLINKSDFAKTTEGQKTLLKAMVLESTDRIKISDKLPAKTNGQWDNDQGIIFVNKNITKSDELVALSIAHEATHAVDNGEYPVQVPNLDSEMRSFKAENAVYNQLSRPVKEGGTGFKDVQYEARTGWEKRGDAVLREAIRIGYQEAGIPLAEHRNSKPVPNSGTVR